MAENAQTFGARSNADLVRLVREYPLAWISSGAGDTFSATLLPLLPVVAEDGRLVALTGHFARANPQVARLRRDGRAAVLLLGPGGYISPSWMSDRSQAPTWNYASAQCLVEIEFQEQADDLANHLHELVGTMEAERPDAWQIEEMGSRYKQLSRRIVSFVARIQETREKYKLGQDERDDVFEDICKGVAERGDDALLAWMVRFNPERAPPD
jgi:transcriptional regulator